MAIDLTEDVEELRGFLAQAKRPTVRTILADELQKLEKKLALQKEREAKEQERERKLEEKRLQREAAPPPPPPPEFVPIATGVTVPQIRYTTLSSLRWDQDAEKVKIFVNTDDGVCEENMVISMDAWSFDVKLHDVGGQNFRYGIRKLNKEIVPDMSRIVVKPNKLVITLKKAESGVDWPVLYYKEETSEEDAKRPPMARLLEMMRHMYDDGDDDMRKTISDAWTTYRDGEDRKRAFQMKKRGLK